MPSRVQRLMDSGETGRRRGGPCPVRHTMWLQCITARVVELAVQVYLWDLHITQGHANVLVTKHLHQSRKADTDAKHLSGVGVPQLVRLDRCRTAGRLGGLFERRAESLIPG